MIEDLLGRHETGNRFPEKNPVVSASLSKKAKGQATADKDTGDTDG